MKRLVLILCLLAAPLWAVQPDEILEDPVLEERARDISAGLRCLVCRNESIVISPVHFKLSVGIFMVILIRLPTKTNHGIADFTNYIVATHQGLLIVAGFSRIIPGIGNLMLVV